MQEGAAEFPDMPCDSSNATYFPLRVVAIILVVYAGLFPIVLFLMLYRIHIVQKRARSEVLLAAPPSSLLSSSSSSSAEDEEMVNEAKYGIFYDHFKAKFYWWEVQVRILFFEIELEKEEWTENKKKGGNIGKMKSFN